MSIDKCHKIIKEYFNDNVQIEPIGNHHLGRHYVFKVTNTKPYVMKFYFKEHKWEREVSSLLLLNNPSYKTPKIIDYRVNKGIEWILYEYSDGNNLSNLSLSEDESKTIYYNLGKEVANIHKNHQYKKFGRLDLSGNFYVENETNEDYIKYIYESTLRNLLKVKHSKQDLITKAIKKLKNDID